MCGLRDWSSSLLSPYASKNQFKNSRLAECAGVLLPWSYISYLAGLTRSGQRDSLMPDCFSLRERILRISLNFCLCGERYKGSFRNNLDSGCCLDGDLYQHLVHLQSNHFCPVQQGWVSKGVNLMALPIKFWKMEWSIVELAN